MSFVTLVAVILISGTLVGVAVGRYPWLRMNRVTVPAVMLFRTR